MSMAMLTVLQIIMVLAAYTSVTLLFPWIFLHKRFAGIRGASAKFMAYFVAGNFYIMNLVFLLQLLHISCWLTLVIGTLLPFAAALFRHRDSVLPVLERVLGRISRITGGEIGKKTLLVKFERKLRRMSSGEAGKWASRHALELVLTLGIVFLVFYMYGTNAVNVYGYCASDMVVHHYWMNEMIHNNIFVDGVYPFGMHCVLYYLDIVFGIPGHVLFRLFGVVQTLMIHLMLLAFLRSVCKSRYAPYAGMALYMLTDRFYEYAYYRYYATLPQEFGMLFILPSAWFAIAFLKEKDFIFTDGKKETCSLVSSQYLILFAAGISMTLAVHFYDTIITGLFCVGIAAGFCFRCFRWRYFRRIVVAGVAGIGIAVLPMAAAWVMGTPLQPSLNWGMSLLSSGSTEAVSEDASDDRASSGSTEAVSEEASDDRASSGGTEAVSEEASDDRASSGSTEAVSEEASDDEASSAETAADKQPVPKVPLSVRMQRLYRTVQSELQYYVTNYDAGMPRFLLGSIGLLFLLGILWFILRRKEYGAVLVSVSIFMLFLTILQSAAALGIPQVVEVSRHAVYYAYGIAAVWSLCLDAVLFLLLRGNHLMDLGSLGTVAAVCVAAGLTGIKNPVCLTAYETNGAMICLENIIRENKDGGTWTICSANDERWMVDEYAHGYHYELITFLRKVEDKGEFASVMIPSSNVYFFIEKIPGLYVDYINTEKPKRTVSAEGAQEPLSSWPGIVPYVGNARWVTMSHMYYWAQEFKRLYPNEMEVYYETDDFVCYRIQQNEYSLYNFAVDYGYHHEAEED